MDVPDLNRQLIRCLRALGRTIRALSEGRASQKRVLRLLRCGERGVGRLGPAALRALPRAAAPLRPGDLPGLSDPGGNG